MEPKGEYEQKLIKHMSFLDVQRSRRDEKIDQDTKDSLDARLDQLVVEADEQGHFDQARFSFINLLRTNNWDDLLPAVYNEAQNAEHTSHGRHGYKPEWEGMVQAAMEGNAAELAILGIKKREQDKGPDTNWLASHGYDEARIERLQKEAKLKNIYDMLPPDPENIVGYELKKQREISQPPSYIDQDALTTSLKDLTNLQRELLQDFQGLRINLDQFLNLSAKQTNGLVERFRSADPIEERKRWADVVRDTEFYQRFTPNVEPQFYTSPDFADRRERMDAIWQLARAAYVKKALASFPDKYKENNDLQLLGKDKLRTLLETPGVKEKLGGYMRSVKNQEKIPVKLDNGTTVNMCIWDCKDINTFNAWRRASNIRELARSPEFRQYVLQEAASYGISPSDNQGIGRVAELLATEDDGIAWGLVSVFCYIESKHTRYGGIEFSSLPGAIESADFRGVFHPQERYEGKMNNKQNWGLFSLWGITQMKRIDEETGKANNDKRGGTDYYEYHFIAADKGDYWTWKELHGTPAWNTEKASKATRAKIIEVRVPECHPITTCKSYLEDPKIEEKLLKGEDLDWDEIGEDDIVVWLFSKFNKGVQLTEYFNPGEKPRIIDISKRGWAGDWASPLTETLDSRLGMGKLYEKDNGIKANSKQNYDKLKVWAVYASTGGINNPLDRRPTFNKGLDPYIIGGALSDKKVHFLKNWRQLFII